MKRQYLGDSKDSFKWDYHDYLTRALDYRLLQVVWMMTPDDGSRDGGTSPECFPARPEILSLCNCLRRDRDPQELSELSKRTRAGYEVALFKSDEFFADHSRVSYFPKVRREPDRVLLLDPDNGFEPEASCCERHVRYGEVDDLLRMISPGSIISVFQHHRRKRFADDFARIRRRLKSGYSTAIYWNALMFVIVASSKEVIGRVLRANRGYAKHKPVTILA
ncbi:MAG: hypothetical protein ABII00_01080 [Elusimicrobiota bacterium]